MTGAVKAEGCSEIKLSKQDGNALFQAELLIKQEGTGLFWLNSYGITWQELFGQRLAMNSSCQNRIGMALRHYVPGHYVPVRFLPNYTSRDVTSRSPNIIFGYYFPRHYIPRHYIPK